MISYEQLCEALERYNARQRHAAEMAALEQEPPSEPAEAPEPAADPTVDDAPDAEAVDASSQIVVDEELQPTYSDNPDLD